MIIMHEKIYINCDGGSRGNPGPAAIGVLIRDNKNRVICEYKEKIGKNTNNVAEYMSLIKSLKLAGKYTRNTVYVRMDSELVVRQVSGIYKVKARHLVPLYTEARSLEANFKKVVYSSVPRNNRFQSEADRLVNEALDGI